jgi:cytochrome c-type biogenesis protein CcmH/NrfG
LNPQAIDAREHLAESLVKQGEVGEAVHQFRKLLELARSVTKHGSNWVPFWHCQVA